MIKNFLPDKSKKIAVGLSGGVDSGLSAYLLKKAGYHIIGYHLGLNSNAFSKQAEKIANFLRIPFYTKDFRSQFKYKVLDRVIDKYRLGKTPNPCILCNKFVRFNDALSWIKRDLRANYIATGHYVRKTKDNHLIRAKDLSKDQSYFLYKLDKNQLNSLFFPLGNWYKKDVWQEAKKKKLPINLRESFDICFAKNWDQFLKKQIPKLALPGHVINTQGEIVGRHRGLIFYTVGSRGGWDWLPDKQNSYSIDNQLPKMFVLSKNIKKNQLIVGNREEVKKKEFEICNLQFTNSDQKKDLYVKIRNTGKLLKCQLKNKKVTLNQPAFGITPGQSAVLYQSYQEDFEIVGGGEIND